MLALLCALLGQANAADAGTVLRRQMVLGQGRTPDIAYSIYLPDGHAAPSARFPVVYLLHGYGASDDEWLAAARLPETLDRMIADGEIAPLIAVMPDAAKSWYVDSPRSGGPGDYETAIVDNLVRAIDGRYQTRAIADSRAIAGVSMGGFGALRLAFKHPDRFRAVAALSPGLFKPEGLSWRHGPALERRANRERWYADIFGTPFDLGLYIAQSPFAYVAQFAEATPRPDILLVVGDDDGLGSYDGTVEMFLELRAAGLKPELRVADGGHDWRFWRAMTPELFRFLDLCWPQP
jgi:enterochelin esterase family protein